MSVLTGCVLQDDLMVCACSFMRRGMDILGVHVAASGSQVDSSAKHTQAALTGDSEPIHGILGSLTLTQ